MSEAITAGTAILSAGFDFITGNAILFGIVAMGLVGTAIAKVKRLF